MRTLVATLVAMVTACGAERRVPGVRFANAPAVATVDDRRDVPHRPATLEIAMWLYHFDGSFFRRLTRALELRGRPRALGVNALDEVPDSTWFTNRIGVRTLTLDELRTAGGVNGSPEAHKPWTIHSTKVGGESLGFIVSDRRGRRFLLKFDRAGYPEMETAAQVIASKLLWACGFNVTEDHIVSLDPADLVLAADATIKGLHRSKHPLRRIELERMLAGVERDSSGRIRGMASWWLPGAPLGGHPAEGVRPDDPNDRIPHERRRDLRGAWPIFAWLDHIDVKQDNTLDTWVSDPRDPARHHVVHHWLDFGKSLGVMAMTGLDARRGYQYKFDPGGMAESLASAGARPRPWDRRYPPGIRGVGLLDAQWFDPATWKPDTPAYLPFLMADDRDRFWGAKLVARFAPAQIRAIVETARLSDPRAVDYITNQLVARQRAIARLAFSRIAPLDRFRIDADRLCFDDLLLAYRLSPLGPVTRYAIEAFDVTGRPTGWSAQLRPDAGGAACTSALALAPGTDAYTIYEIATTRPGFRGRTFVHVARNPIGGAIRVIGIWRP